MNAERPKSIEEAFIHIDYVRASQADIMRALEEIKEQLHGLPDISRRLDHVEKQLEQKTFSAIAKSLLIWLALIGTAGGAVAAIALTVREIVHWTDRASPPSHDAQKQAAPK